MFNESQLEAINHIDGPALVLAGPGSGKTTVITRRTKKLIEEGVSPDNILVVTFTKAAAVEMQERFTNLMNESDSNRNEIITYPVSFGTFHSIFYRIIQDSNGRKCSILTEQNKADIIKEIVARLKVQTNDLMEFTRCIIGEISKVKGNGIPLDEYESLVCKKEEFDRIYAEYNCELRENNKIDFDDMVIICNEIFKNDEKALQKWRDKYRYVLIDEFQDINKMQYENIKMLITPRNNVFIVGDDDQAIYGFRGSVPRLMFDFKKDFPDCKEILLNINYRCPEEVLQMSLSLIENNKERFSKKIIANKKFKDINKPDVRIFYNQKEEFEYIAKKINQYQKAGIELKNIAILVRNNSQIPSIKNVFSDYRINSSVKKKKQSIYDNSVGKDILSYVRCAYSDLNKPICENEDLVRIMNKPVRYISRQVMNDNNMNFYNLKKIYGHNDEIMNNIRKLEFHFKMIRRMNPAACVLYIKNGCNYEKYLQQYSKEKGIKFSKLSDIINIIQYDAQKYETVEAWMKHAMDNETAKECEGVNIITMHSAKGLEFEVVFMVDANQGLIPSARAIKQDEVEEERRLFYVAMTRTKKKLHIFGMRQNLGNTMQMSQFVGEALQF